MFFVQISAFRKLNIKEKFNMAQVKKLYKKMEQRFYFLLRNSSLNIRSAKEYNSFIPTQRIWELTQVIVDFGKNRLKEDACTVKLRMEKYHRQSHTTDALLEVLVGEWVHGVTIEDGVDFRAVFLELIIL